jgi:chromosome segregation ATPase
LANSSSDHSLTVNIPEDAMQQALQEATKKWLESRQASFDKVIEEERLTLAVRIRSLEEEVDKWRSQVAERRDSVDEKLDLLEKRIEKRASRVFIPLGLVVLTVLTIGLWGVFEARLKDLRTNVDSAEASVAALRKNVETAEGSVTDMLARAGSTKLRLNDIEGQESQLQERITALNQKIPEAAKLTADLTALCKRVRALEGRNAKPCPKPE